MMVLNLAEPSSCNARKRMTHSLERNMEWPINFPGKPDLGQAMPHLYLST